MKLLWRGVRAAAAAGLCPRLRAAPAPTRSAWAAGGLPAGPSGRRR
jgi:hypothetical protein